MKSRRGKYNEIRYDMCRECGDKIWGIINSAWVARHIRNTGKWKWSHEAYSNQQHRALPVDGCVYIYEEDGT